MWYLKYLERFEFLLFVSNLPVWDDIVSYHALSA